MYPVDDPWRGATVYIDPNGFVTDIVEKPPKGASKSNLNNEGLFVSTPVIFDSLRKIKKSPRGEYELTDAIKLMIGAGYKVKAVELSGYWGDMATPEDVLEMSRLLEKMEES